MNRRRFLTAATGAAAAVCATGPSAFAATPAPAGSAPLRTWFEATYRSITATTTDLGLTADKIDVSGTGAPVPSAQTSPTNIGCGLWSTVAAAGLGVIPPSVMHDRLSRTVTAVERLERAHGWWFNWYDAHDGSILTTWPENGSTVRPFLSTVDNAWLVTGLRIAADADPALRPRIARLLDGADWSYYYTPYDPADPVTGPGQLRGGYWPDKPGKGEPTGHHYGALNTEPRMASYLGIADGSLPADHYWHLFRTLLPGMGQEQVPEGAYVTIDGIRVWEGHYTYRGRKLVPTWGGSMFEALMVPLFVPEPEWSPRSWGTTHQRYVRSQIEHGLDEEKYGYWGFSPANIPEGGYREYGVDAIGMQEDGYNSLGVVTPHASFLALPQAPAEALANLRALDRDFGAYDDRYGFRDSVNVTTGRVSDFVLALDQGMIAAALAQQLRPGLLQRPFRTGGFRSRVRPLLGRERFSI
ncbi:glucoamylase family protein [Streptomyces gilvifuscus]|uniref:Glucoamylase family protein n=1 Tax=Streptomyces gilvifuscus TaxID=1550617 RepID=A0ABT5FZW1_9ACTN|nr:glucoamylase family protein [Streptomyces gilvifuscus]MDC2958064.1 glucoamylase family protein [Streptomyces gilvifuscus]